MAMDEFYCPMLTIPQGKQIQFPRRRGRHIRGRIRRRLLAGRRLEILRYRRLAASLHARKAGVERRSFDEFHLIQGGGPTLKERRASGPGGSTSE
jgi:hypothetical protein